MRPKRIREIKEGLVLFLFLLMFIVLFMEAL